MFGVVRPQTLSQQVKVSEKAIALKPCSVIKMH